jgi:hypothetical protein
MPTFTRILGILSMSVLSVFALTVVALTLLMGNFGYRSSWDDSHGCFGLYLGLAAWLSVCLIIGAVPKASTWLVSLAAVILLAAHLAFEIHLYPTYLSDVWAVRDVFSGLYLLVIYFVPGCLFVGLLTLYWRFIRPSYP